MTAAHNLILDVGLSTARLILMIPICRAFPLISIRDFGDPKPQHEGPLTSITFRTLKDLELLGSYFGSMEPFQRGGSFFARLQYLRHLNFLNLPFLISQTPKP